MALLVSTVDGQVPNPAFPVGGITAQLFNTAGGSKANLTWLIRLPDGDDPAGYTHFIRQIRSQDGVTIDLNVSSSGQMLSTLPLDPGSSRFELWSVRNSTLEALFLDTTVCSTYLPSATVTIHSEDPYPYLPRTRADRPFQVDVTVQGLLSGEQDPESAKSVTLARFVQSYGSDGIGDDIDRSQAALLSQASITDNGSQVLAFVINSIPGADRAKIRGEERFTILTVEDYDLPSSVISSRFIQIWPVADAVIIGIADGQTIGPVVPSVTFQLNDLYPDSTTWAQVYKGASQSAATGRTVPGSMVEINSATPQNRVVVVGNYLPLFDSDGLWTMEILTRTPFGTDRLSSVSFTVQGTGVIRENWRQFHFGSSANSGDGADLYDFDHDGIPNLVEFAFGLNPKQADSAVLPTPQLSGDQLAIMFTRPEEVAGITYAAEWSPDLLADSWQAVSDTGIFPQHAFSVPSVGNQRVFMRLKVTGQ